MIFYSFTTASTQARTQFQEILFLEDELLSPYQIKIHACPFLVYLVAGGVKELQLQEIMTGEREMLVDLHRGWSILRDSTQSGWEARRKAISIFQRYGENVSSDIKYDDTLTYAFTDDPEQQRYFVILKKARHLNIPLEEIKYLSYIWKINQGCLPLHASGVIRNNQVYVFSAPSGTGKSTVSDLSKQLGYQVLDDDQLMVFPNSKGDYSAEGWGYSLQSTAAQVKGFFRLVQADLDNVEKLTQLRTARLFWEQSSILIGKKLTLENRQRIFRGIAEFSRTVPGYELHFRQSPDFWKQIDAVVPSD